MESLGQNPVGRFVVHATTASGRADSVSPSSSGMRHVRLAVAITTHAEAPFPSSAPSPTPNSVTQSDDLTLLAIRYLGSEE